MRRVVRRETEPVLEDQDDDDDVDPEDEDDEDLEEEDDEDVEVVRAGWDGYRETKLKGGAFAEFLRLEAGEEATLLKFLEPGPFASYRQHWVEGLHSTAKKSFICIEDDCPLCDLGQDSGFKIAFNIVVIPLKGPPTNKVWEVGPRIAETLQAKVKEKRTSPLNRSDLYWAASRAGKKQKTVYSVDPVKARDLEEDWGVQPLSELELEKYLKKIYDKKVIKVPTRLQLKKIAAELNGEDIDDEDDDDEDND